MDIPATHRPILEALESRFSDIYIRKVGDIRFEVSGTPLVHFMVSQSVNDGAIEIIAHPYIFQRTINWVTIHYEVETGEYLLLVNPQAAWDDRRWKSYSDLFTCVADGLRLRMEHEVAALRDGIAAYRNQ